MRKARALSLLLAFGAQALVGGVVGVLHLCAQADAQGCRCPHGEKADAPLSWRAVDCCQTQTLGAQQAQARPDTVRPQHDLPVVASLAPAWMLPQPLEQRPLPGFGWRVAPPSQGPPIYLKVQSLLN